MIRLPCGYDPMRHLQRRGGCGIWLDWDTAHILNGVPWCPICEKGLRIKHLGQGIFVRPKEESDNLPLPAGPGLEEIYG